MITIISVGRRGHIVAIQEVSSFM